MVRGILSGAIWGILVAGISLAMASLLAEQPPGREAPAAPQVESPELSDGAEASGDGAVAVPDEGEPPVATEAPRTEQPAEGEGTQETGATEPADRPEPGDEAEAPAQVEPGGPAPEVTTAETDAVGRPPASTAPTAPESDTEPSVASEPAAARPEPASEAEAPAAVAEGGSPPDVSAEESDPVETSAAAEAPRSPEPESPPEVAGGQAAERPEAGDTADAPGEVAEGGEAPAVAATESDPVLPPPPTRSPQTPEAENDLTVATEPPTDPSPSESPTETAQAPAPSGEEPPTIEAVGDAAVSPETPEQPAETAEAPSAPRTPRIPEAPLPEASGDTPQFVEILPEGETPDTEPQTERSRFQLSSETGSTLPGEPASSPEASEEGEPSEEDEDRTALERYAAATPSGEGPRVGIVLMDEGGLPGAAEALAAMPMPVTVAIDPADPEAPAKARAYRAAGAEIGVLAEIPAGATPQDIEVIIEAVFRTVPEAAMLVDTGSAGLSGGDALEQIMTALSAEGRGYITKAQGLGTALRFAETAGVPAAEVSRDLDAEGQEARVIRRFLEQAAFRARQEDTGTIVLARMRPDTISALILWGTAMQDGDIVPGPASALLLPQLSD
ncbi:divergent polysaccharide deacetylase family protein [Histidinibacterium aquaticum]|uniref:Divergent polysaccharide deacetylase family protein n=1 Tax=Histidinibacterium aquaticum TaxID=2613962 RepID=A0A5J5GNH8_9RHOB|nr:divergent polysaccharide deacetylase family protein [Histidinibacterium aquaticum]KAA9009128.1 hypothetical protein F3S47_07695 [Histidinibacterium aquaticum]